MESITIIGVGRMGGALAIALAGAGHRIDRLISKNSASADGDLRERFPESEKWRILDEETPIASEIIIIATGDDAIRSVADRIGPRLKREQVLLHLSGALTSDILRGNSREPFSAGSMHPLVSVSDAKSGSTAFRGAFFCIEGQPTAVDAATTLAVALGGSPFTIASEYKPLYHAAAVMASGHMTTLAAEAVRTLSACGLEPAEAKRIIMPLIQSTVANFARQEFAQALTGPFARGDAEAVARHVTAFEHADIRNELSVYLQLGLAAASLAEENGTDADKVRNVITLALRQNQMLK